MSYTRVSAGSLLTSKNATKIQNVYVNDRFFTVEIIKGTKPCETHLISYPLSDITKATASTYTSTTPTSTSTSTVKGKIVVETTRGNNFIFDEIPIPLIPRQYLSNEMSNDDIYKFVIKLGFEHMFNSDQHGRNRYSM